MKFVNFTGNWLNQKRGKIKTSTLNSYQGYITKYINPFFKDYEVSDVNIEVLKKFKKYLSNLGISHNTQNKIMNFLNSMLYQKENEEKEIEEYLNNNQFKKLINYLKIRKSRTNVMILFAVYTGINIGELCGIKAKDINFKDNTIMISTTISEAKDRYNKRKLVENKSSRIRMINVENWLIKEIESLQTEPEFFIVSGGNTLPEKRNLQKSLNQISKVLSIKLTFKILQSTFIVNSIEKGSNLAQIARTIGTSQKSLERRGYNKFIQKR